MDLNFIIDGLILYLGLLVLLTFHEFGHAWMALKCGDETARQEGRCSLNPLVHIDPIGTVALPLLMLLLPGAGRFLIGWARPVPVNPLNFRNPRLDDMLVSLAGPWMNVALAVALMGLARLGLEVGLTTAAVLCAGLARLSVLLCFFNLIPIPPLDGSHVLRQLIGMSHETYHHIARYGFIILIVVLQIPVVRESLSLVTDTCWRVIGGWFGVPVG